MQKLNKWKEEARSTSPNHQLAKKTRNLSTKMQRMSVMSGNNLVLQTQAFEYDNLVNNTISKIVNGKPKKFAPQKKSCFEGEVKGAEPDVRSVPPKARITRFCHSKIDEMSCQSFLNFIKKYDQNTTQQIINDALIPDILDIRSSHSNRLSSLKAAIAHGSQPPVESKE